MNDRVDYGATIAETMGNKLPEQEYRIIVKVAYMAIMHQGLQVMTRLLPLPS